MKVWLLLSMLLLSACTKQESSLDDYVKRLENVLERDAIKVEKEFSAPFPELRQLQLKLPPSELSIREFLSLRECKLHTVVAHRNSQLGKVSSASQKLFSDLSIINHGPECVEKLGKSKLASKLRLFIKQKERNLNTVLWHALLAQAEHASFWHRGVDSGKPLNVSAEITHLSEFSDQVLNGKTAFSKQQYDDIERHLGRLRFGGGGRLIDEYKQLIVGLKRANSVVQQRLDQPLCLSNTPTEQAHFFKNVVNTFFIKEVQKNTVALNNQAKQLITPFYQLEKPLLKYSSPDYKAWVSKRDKILAEGKSAVLEHVRLLQQLYQQCGLTPG